MAIPSLIKGRWDLFVMSCCFWCFMMWEQQQSSNIMIEERHLALTTTGIRYDVNCFFPTGGFLRSTKYVRSIFLHLGDLLRSVPSHAPPAVGRMYISCVENSAIIVTSKAFNASVRGAMAPMLLLSIN
jgi:hypothetical protein